MFQRLGKGPTLALYISQGCQLVLREPPTNPDSLCQRFTVTEYHSGYRPLDVTEPRMETRGWTNRVDTLKSDRGEIIDSGNPSYRERS